MTTRCFASEYAEKQIVVLWCFLPAEHVGPHRFTEEETDAKD